MTVRPLWPDELDPPPKPEITSQKLEPIMKRVFATTAGIIAAVVLSLAVIIGLFFLGWWIKEYAVNRNAEIRQDSYGRQNALVEQILDDIAEAESNIPPAQRVAIIDGICDSEAKLTGSIELPTNAQRFIQENCS